MSPSNSYVEALTPSATIFGDKVFREIKLNEVISVEPESNRTGALIRTGRDTRALSLSLHVYTEERPCEAERRDLSPETNPPGTLMLGFLPPEL